jgi:hypothetical protein
MSAMFFLPPTRRRDDERRAPFAQVRLAASVLVRVEALVAKDASSRDSRHCQRKSDAERHALAKNVQRIVIVQHVSVICMNRNP